MFIFFTDFQFKIEDSWIRGRWPSSSITNYGLRSRVVWSDESTFPTITEHAMRHLTCRSLRRMYACISLCWSIAVCLYAWPLICLFICLAAYRRFGFSLRMFAFLCDSLLTWLSLRVLFDMPQVYSDSPSVMRGSTPYYLHDCLRRGPERAWECGLGNVRCRESTQ